MLVQAPEMCLFYFENLMIFTTGVVNSIAFGII